MTLSDKDRLLRMRDDYLDRLITTGSESGRRELVGQVKALDRAIEAVAPTPLPTRFGKYKRFREAAEVYLREVGRAVSEDELVEALVNGGWRPGKETALSDARKGVGYYIGNPKGEDLQVFKRLNGLIGLYEWPDERFR